MNLWQIFEVVVIIYRYSDSVYLSKKTYVSKKFMPTMNNMAFVQSTSASLLHL